MPSTSIDIKSALVATGFGITSFCMDSEAFKGTRASVGSFAVFFLAPALSVRRIIVLGGAFVEMIVGALSVGRIVVLGGAFVEMIAGISVVLPEKLLSKLKRGVRHET